MPPPSRSTKPPCWPSSPTSIERFEAEAISFEDFSAAKEALIERLDSR